MFHTQSPSCLQSSVLSSKSSFSVIEETSSFSCCFSVFLLSNLDWFWSSKRQNNCSHISDEHLLDWSSSGFTWFSINHVLVSNLIIRIFWGTFVSRSFTFTVPQRRNDLHLTSSEERLFLHLSISIGLHCIICLDHFNLILLRHIIGDIEWPLIFRLFCVNICSIKISLIYITSIRVSPYKYQHLQQIAYFCFESHIEEHISI